VNTFYTSNNAAVPEGMSHDGSFKLSHILDHVPPKESVFYLKHLSFESGGDDADFGGRNKTPTTWVSMNIPQMDDEIITKDVEKITQQGFDNAGVLQQPYVEDYGTLRFPLISYPGSGTSGGIPANRIARNDDTSLGQQYSQRSSLNMNVKLGRMKLEGGVLDCILTPREHKARTAYGRDHTPSPQHLARIRQIQVILEYN